MLEKQLKREKKIRRKLQRRLSNHGNSDNVRGVRVTSPNDDVQLGLPSAVSVSDHPPSEAYQITGLYHVTFTRT